jgi:hypothetical protein
MDKKNLQALLKLAVYMEQDENVAKVVHAMARNVETVKETADKDRLTYNVKANLTGMVDGYPVKSDGINICITKRGVEQSNA